MRKKTIDWGFSLDRASIIQTSQSPSTLPLPLPHYSRKSAKWKYIFSQWEILHFVYICILLQLFQLPFHSSVIVACQDNAEWSHLTRRHGMASRLTTVPCQREPPLLKFSDLLRTPLLLLPGFQLLMSVVISGEATWHIISLSLPLLNIISHAQESSASCFLMVVHHRSLRPIHLCPRWESLVLITCKAISSLKHFTCFDFVWCHLYGKEEGNFE